MGAGYRETPCILYAFSITPIVSFKITQLVLVYIWNIFQLGFFYCTVYNTGPYRPGTRNTGKYRPYRWYWKNRPVLWKHGNFVVSFFKINPSFNKTQAKCKTLLPLFLSLCRSTFLSLSWSTSLSHFTSAAIASLFKQLSCDVGNRG